MEGNTVFKIIQRVKIKNRVSTASADLETFKANLHTANT